MTQENPYWNNVRMAHRTIFSSMNEGFSKTRASTPNLSQEKDVFVVSDYGGESTDEPYKTYSILITGRNSFTNWEALRLQLRAKQMPDNRRMSYKKLNDRYRREFLKDFLKIADSIDGISVTFSISKTVGSIFESYGPLDLSNPQFEEFRNWRKDVLEKAFTIMDIIGILIAGLTKSGQNVFWITDQDSIAANPTRLQSLTSAFSWIASTYLDFDLGHLRVGTTACDDGSRQLEDLAAIPDLIAGGISEQYRSSANADIQNDKIFWTSTPFMNQKAIPINMWLATSQLKLKKHLFVIESKDGKLHTSWFNYTHP